MSKKIEPEKVRKDFKRQLKEAALKLSKEPHEVSMAEFLAECKEANYSHIKHVGGFTNLQKLFYPKPLVEQAGNKIVTSHLKKIDSTYGNLGYLLRELEASLLLAVSSMPLKTHKPVKMSNSKPCKRATVLDLSDLHYGMIANKKEVHNNEFNWLVASRRTAHVFDQAVKYKQQYRKDSELVVLLNGDVLHGVIHDLYAVEPLTDQFVGALHILSQGISYAACNYPSVRVVCTTGNHGRNPIKHPGRAVSHKWDSFETMLYKTLEIHLTSKHKNVSFNIDKTIFADMKLHGHRFFISHGDTGFNLGNPGKSINIKSIVEQINKINAAEKHNQHYNAFLFGHLHTALYMTIDSGVDLVLNGCLGGVDSFSNSIGIYDNPVVQVLFECTPEHPVGDVRFLKLKCADSNSELDKIIQPYEGV